MCCWSKFPETVISDFKDKRSISNHIAEMNIITKAKKWICHKVCKLNTICAL